jgi:hypothetical protein
VASLQSCSLLIADSEVLFGCGEQMQTASDEPGPSGLMAGAESGSIVAVKVIMEYDQIVPMLAIMKLRGASVKPAGGRPCPVKR